MKACSPHTLSGKATRSLTLRHRTVNKVLRLRAGAEQVLERAEGPIGTGLLALAKKQALGPA